MASRAFARLVDSEDIEARLDTPLDALRLPARFETFAYEAKLVTIRDVLAAKADALRRKYVVGALSFEGARQAIEAHLGMSWDAARAVVDPAAALADRNGSGVLAALPGGSEDLLRVHATWLPLFRDVVSQLPEPKRLVVEGRAGLSGGREKLRSLSERFGITEQAVQFREQSALESMRQGAWVLALRRRLDAALEAPLAARVLAERDDFFAPPAPLLTFRYFVVRVLRGCAVVAAGRDDLVLERAENGLGGDEDRESGVRLAAPRATPRTAPAHVVDFVAASREPIAIADLVSKFGPGLRAWLGTAIVHLDHGVATHASNLEGWNEWRERLVELSIEVLERHARDERPWRAGDIVDQLRKDGVRFPSWVNRWSLASILRGEARLDEIGPGVVRLRDSA